MSWVTPWRTDVPAFFRALWNANGTAEGTIVALRFEDESETVIELEMIDRQRFEDEIRGPQDKLLPRGFTVDPDPENEPGIDGLEAWVVKFDRNSDPDAEVEARAMYYKQGDYHTTEAKTVDAVREGES